MEDKQICNIENLTDVHVDKTMIKTMDTFLNSQRLLCLKLDQKHNTDLIKSIDSDNFESKSKWIYMLISCIHNELEELRNWFPWKSWKEYKEYDFKQCLPEIKYEIIDIFHFLLEIMLIMNMSGEEVVKMYYAKRKINFNRQENNY